MTIIAKLVGTLNAHAGKAHLVAVISMNSKKQTGDNFSAFTCLLEQLAANHTIDKLIVVLTGYLHRHYIALDESLTENEIIRLANKLDSDWEEENQRSLDKLKLTFDCEIIRWDKLLEDKEKFKPFFDKINRSYYDKKSKEFDEVFYKNVYEFSGQTYAKSLHERLQKKIPTIEFEKCQKAAIEYSLEEISIIPVLNSLGHYFFYPSEELNPGFWHVYKNYVSSTKNSIQYREYQLVKEPSLAQSVNKNEYFSKRSLRHYVSNTVKRALAGTKNPETLPTFYKKFTKLTAELIDDEEKFVCRHRRRSL